MLKKSKDQSLGVPTGPATHVPDLQSNTLGVLLMPGLQSNTPGVRFVSSLPPVTVEAPAHTTKPDNSASNRMCDNLYISVWH